jgi:molybdopterin/thiamine biosynthesis adenylyltransferase
LSTKSDPASLIVLDEDVVRLYAELDAPRDAYLDDDSAESILRLLPPRVTSPLNVPAKVHFDDNDVSSEGLHIFAAADVDGYLSAETISIDAAGARSPLQNILISRDAVFSTTHGIYETDVLRRKRVAVIGLGSGGGMIALELAKAGVGGFVLIDDDRLEPKNIARHVCGISDLGRFKTRAMRDMILDRNPLANITTSETRCSLENRAVVERLLSDCDVILACTDNRESRILINSIALAQQRPAIYGGTFRRAYGGQVIRVIPSRTICYQCFIDLLPDVAADREIENEAQAAAIAYSDRVVRVEPGLASDIAPVSLLCVKLAILELLRGTQTDLVSLYDDLKAPWFRWLNRREKGTDYEQLPPLDEEGDSLRVLAWYGVNVDRNVRCPACGDFFAGYVPDAATLDRFASTVAVDDTALEEPRVPSD